MPKLFLNPARHLNKTEFKLNEPQNVTLETLNLTTNSGDNSVLGTEVGIPRSNEIPLETTNLNNDITEDSQCTLLPPQKNKTNEDLVSVTATSNFLQLFDSTKSELLTIPISNLNQKAKYVVLSIPKNGDNIVTVPLSNDFIQEKVEGQQAIAVSSTKISDPISETTTSLAEFYRNLQNVKLGKINKNNSNSSPHKEENIELSLPPKTYHEIESLSDTETGTSILPDILELVHPSKNKLDETNPDLNVRQINETFETVSLAASIDNNTISANKILFENLMTKPDLTFQNWTIYKSLSAHKCILFAQMAVRNSLPVMGKQLILNDHLKIEYFIGQNNIIVPLPTTLNCEEDLENILFEFDEIKICEGGPYFNKYSEMTNITHIGKIDYSTGCWRHINCQYIVPSNVSECKYCSYLWKYFFRNRKANLQKRNNGFKKSDQDSLQSYAEILEKTIVKQKNTITILKNKISYLEKKVQWDSPVPGNVGSLQAKVNTYESVEMEEVDSDESD